MESLSAGEKIRRGLSWILTAAVVGTIFYFSAQKGTDSTKSSNAVTELFYEMLHNGEELTELVLLELMDVFTRSAAHVIEYMILSVCVGILASAYRIRGQIRSVYMVFVGFFISILDEALQTFVPGRYGDLSDIAADTLGAGLVAFVFYSAWKSRCRREPLPEGPECRSFMNIRLDDIGQEKTLDRILQYAADAEGKHYIVTPNADHMIRLEKDDRFLRAYRGADLVVPDGTPLLWIAASTGHPLRERVTGADLFERVCERAAKENRSVFFLGGFQNAAESAAKAMAEKYRGLNVVGAVSPEADFDTDTEKTGKILQTISAAKPDILFFCIGAPRSEIFLHTHRNELNCRVALPFGTAIDYAAGESRRAPLWMQKAGLEWFYRFLQEPGRLFQRYFIEDIQIFRLVLKYRVALLAGGREGEKTCG